MIWAFVQRVLAALLLVVLSPVLLLLAIAILLTSRGGALHRATRVSRGQPFTMLKLRTMAEGAQAIGTGVTAAGDPRVTRLGRYLRSTKLDELPQLWNVLVGEMLLVGPRPEDPRYVDWSDPLHRLVFGSRPGITGPTALEYGDEETQLAEAAGAAARGARPLDPEAIERIYRDQILPRKLQMDADYLRTRSWRGDVAILARTIGLMLRRSGRP